LPKLLVALAVMGSAVVRQGSGSLWLSASGIDRAIHLACALVRLAAIGVYFATLWILGFRLRDFNAPGKRLNQETQQCN
jgi:putative peptidoglycan lipid II flippase